METSCGEMRETENWLPQDSLTVGITSGASTPDKVVENVLEAIFKSRAKMKVRCTINNL